MPPGSRPGPARRCVRRPPPWRSCARRACTGSSPRTTARPSGGTRTCCTRWWAGCRWTRGGAACSCSRSGSCPGWTPYPSGPAPDVTPPRPGGPGRGGGGGWGEGQRGVSPSPVRGAPAAGPPAPGSAHLLQPLALRLPDEFQDEGDGEGGEDGVDHVGRRQVPGGKRREAGGDGPVGDPLRGGGHAQRGGADPVGGHLAEHAPDDPTPGQGADEPEDAGGDQGGPALGGGQLAVDEVEGEGPGLQSEADHHADGADDGQRPAADPVDEDHRDDGADDVDDRRGEGVEERVRGVDADRLPQGGRVVEGDVDADELLEDRQADTDPDDRLEEEAAAEEVLEAGLLLPVHRGPDLADAGVQVDVRALDLFEDL